MLVQSITGVNLDSVLTRLLPAGLVPATNIATGACVLVGTADWGPINQVTPVGTMNAYVSQFATYAQNAAKTADTTGYLQAWGFFNGGSKRRISGGGSDLRVIRVANATKAYATSAIMDNATSPAVVGTLSGLYYGAAGNGIQRTIAPGNTFVATPAAPTLAAATTGGSLANGTVFVTITAVNNVGETIASAEASVAVTGPTGTVTVTFPALPTGASGWNVYAASATGAEIKANGTTAVTGATYAITALPSGTAPAPTANTAYTSWTLTVIPFDNTPNEVYPNLTNTTAAAAINGVSKYVTYAAGVSTMLPPASTAYLSGGDSGLLTTDADYVGVPGQNPTGFELARTVSDANFLISGKMSAAIKSEMKSVANQLYAMYVIGPNDSTVTVAAAITEALSFNDWMGVYLYGYQNWLNPVSGVTQSVLPAGSAVGALCNGPYWVNLSQCKLNGYLGPTNPLSDNDANTLAGNAITPITAGSICRKGNSLSQNPVTSQIEDFRIPVFIAKSADATVQPLIAEPQVVDPATGQSNFFDDIREALEQMLRQQPKEAVQSAYVNATFDAGLASQNKARVAVVVRQTGKANQIVVDATVGRSAIAVVPAGVNLIAGT